MLDRIIYHQVIDYFLIGTAIINISDLLIVGGLVIYLLSLRARRSNPKVQYLPTMGFLASLRLLAMTMQTFNFLLSAFNSNLCFSSLIPCMTIGLDCLPVDVEVDINKGQSAFNIVGLPDASISEAKDRIHSALKFGF